jgi:hypothetical protein
MSELWKPSNEHDDFFTQEDVASGEQLNSTLQAFRVEAEAAITALARAGRMPSDLGAAFGKSLIRSLHLTPEFLKPEMIEMLEEDLFDFYTAALEDKNKATVLARKNIGGFIGEYGLSRALLERPTTFENPSLFQTSPYKVFPSTINEDVANGIDWWLSFDLHEGAENTVVGLQNKSLPPNVHPQILMNLQNHGFIHPLRNSNDVAAVVELLNDGAVQDRSLAGSKENQDYIGRILGSCKSQRELARSYRNIIPAISFTPSISENTRYWDRTSDGRLNGRPSNYLTTRMWASFNKEEHWIGP